MRANLGVSGSVPGRAKMVRARQFVLARISVPLVMTCLGKPGDLLCEFFSAESSEKWMRPPKGCICFYVLGSVVGEYTLIDSPGRPAPRG